MSQLLENTTTSVDVTYSFIITNIYIRYHNELKNIVDTKNNCCQSLETIVNMLFYEYSDCGDDIDIKSEKIYQTHLVLISTLHLPFDFDYILYNTIHKYISIKNNMSEKKICINYICYILYLLITKYIIENNIKLLK